MRHPTALATLGERRRPVLEADAGVPWWNRRATAYLAARLRPGDRVLEWGAGASTVWLAARGAHVTSVEHNPEWVAKARARCPAAEVRLAPTKDEYVAAADGFPDASLDVIIVDGRWRQECVLRGAPKVRPGGMLVVDDTDRRRMRPWTGSLPGWHVVRRAGFKATGDLRETSFFHRPVG